VPSAICLLVLWIDSRPASVHFKTAFAAKEEIMDIKPSGSVPSRRMPGDWFTGTVWQDPIIEAPAPAHPVGAREL
jgi:hypothetical protein